MSAEDPKAEIPTLPNNLQDVGDVLGKFKRWQIIYFASLVYIYGVTGWPSLSMTFLAPNINFNCERPDQFEFGGNWSESDDHCSATSNENETQQCTKWTFDHSFYTETFTEKYSLVCSRQYMISLSNSLHHIGDIFATVYLSYMADRFGRRPVLIMAIIPGITACFMAQFAPNMIVFLVAKFLFGMSGMSLASIGFVLLMEITGVEHRGILGIAVEFGWVTFYVALPGLAYLLRDSFYIQMAITIGYLLLISLYWTVPESPRWQILHGKLDKAEETMTRACRINKIPITNMKQIVQELSMVIQSSEKDANRSYTILDLFRLPFTRQRTLVLYIYWFVNGFVYYGISLNADIFGGNVFLSFFLFGIVEYPAYLLFSFVLGRYGRLWPLGLSMGFAGIFCCLVGIVPKSISWAVIVLTVLGKFCIASSFALAYPYTSEAYPTAVRSTALGSCSTCARIAGAIAPFARELESMIGLPAVMGIFGGMGIISGALVYYLPETKGLNLPDTLLQGELLGNEEAEHIASTVNIKPMAETNGTFQTITDQFSFNES